MNLVYFSVISAIPGILFYMGLEIQNGSLTPVPTMSSSLAFGFAAYFGLLIIVLAIYHRPKAQG